MFTFSKKQQQVFDQVKLNGFVTKSLLFLKTNFKNWCSNKTEADLHDFIYAAIEFGSHYNIRREISIQKLMHYFIEFNFEIAKHNQLRACLLDKKHSEAQRLQNFYLLLVSGNYQLSKIKLSSKI